MQVINVNDILGGSDSDRVSTIASQNAWLDRDLLMDTFLILKGGSASYVPDETLLKDLNRTDPGYWDSRMDMTSRKSFLEGLAKSRFMEGLLKIGDTFKALLQFVDSMKRAFISRENYFKNRGPIEAASGSSPCAYWDEAALDELAKNRKEGAYSTFDDYISNLTTEHDVLQDDASVEFYSGCGLISYYDATHLEKGSLSNSVIRQGINLPASYPVLFKWYTKIVDDLGVKKLKDKDAEDQKEKKKEDVLDDLDKVQQVDASDIGREDFEARVAMKSLDIKKDIEEEEGNCHLFILLDVSGSMMCSDVGGQKICRAFAANVVTMGLLNFAMKENYVVHVVPFAGALDNKVITANDRDSAMAAMRWLGGQAYDGGGTNISRAVLYAYEELTKNDKYKKCDIVLITDGCSEIYKSVITDKPSKTKLRTIMCAPDVYSFYKKHAERLRDASDSWADLGWDMNNDCLSVEDALDGINNPNSND